MKYKDFILRTELYSTTDKKLQACYVNLCGKKNGALWLKFRYHKKLIESVTRQGVIHEICVQNLDKMRKEK